MTLSKLAASACRARIVPPGRGTGVCRIYTTEHPGLGRAGQDSGVGQVGRGGERMADVDQVVGDDAQADPALDAGHAFVAAAVQTMAALEQTDATFTPGAPSLGVAEPAFLLEPLSLSALGGAIGNGHSLDAPSLSGILVSLREEGGIGGDEVGLAAQELL